MPTQTLAASLLAAVAALVARSPAGRAGRRRSFSGCLGSVELWGKREQRAAAEAIDTVDHNHWLVAQIQGRPRLEKPPLPRWSIAALMILTGRRDEWIIRLPGALAGVATVALVYVLGRRMGAGHWDWPRPSSSVRWVSSWVRCARPATTVCSCCSRPWPCTRLIAVSTTRMNPHLGTAQARKRAPAAGSGTWSSTPRSGLGFLTKGPVILLLVGVTLVPYLAFSRRLTWGLRRLFDGWGLLLFVSLALGWPAAVLLDDPAALRVWSLEMSEKTGLSHILEHRWHSPLVGQWPGLVLPWTLIAAVAVLLPSRVGDRRLETRPSRDAGASTRARAGRTASGSPGGGPSATSSCSAPGRSPSRIITSRACPAWPC